MADATQSPARTTIEAAEHANQDRRLVDAPLAADVRLLSSLLGDMIRTVDGDEVFDAVEELRGLAQRRRGVRQEPEPQLTAEIVQLVQSWPLWLAAEVGNAFLTYFLLTNTAEETHRIRRRRVRSSDSQIAPRSIPAVVEQLRSRGIDEDTARRLLVSGFAAEILDTIPLDALREHTALVFSGQATERPG